ncbi:TPA: hypothetical protein EYP66_12435 [Candidatus Poribacteria bacterium]|nr:hypothetical protein [Candidatus Poribacteria bacterium]
MRISKKALVIGILFVVIICFIVSYAELVITYIQIGFLQLPPAVIGVFFFLVVASRLLKKLTHRFRLTQQELMMIYCMMLIASMISSRGMMEKLIPALVAVNYYANEPNGWDKLFFPHIKSWLAPFDPTKKPRQSIVIGFYEHLDPNEPIPFGPWVRPLLVWGVLILLIFFGFLCLASILRRQWVDNEKLTFPLVQLPLEFVRDEETGGFFKNRLMWLGFGLPTLIFTLNGLHGIYPSVPWLRLQHNLNQFFTERPFSAMYYTPAFISFAAVGFFYLLPTQLLFSLWAFFIFTRLQDILAAAFGMRVSGMPLYPTRLYIGYQVAGAYLVLVVYFIYVSGSHLKQVLKRVFTQEAIDDTGELLPYRVAFWGLIISFLLSVLWCYYSGLTLWFAFFELLIYIGFVAVVMARSTAEGGLLMTETSFRPIDLYVMVAQKASLGASSLTFLSFFDAIFTRDQRGLILTGFLDGLKIADGVKMKRRSLLVFFFVAIILALVCSATIHLWLPYRHGANYMYSYVYRGNPLWAFSDHAPALEGFSTEVGWRRLTFFIIGIIFTAFLAFMRTLYWWWPFHPLGYALSASWTMIVFWFPVFLAWLVKYPLMRYGGVRLYLRIRPFFLGMIFGEFSMAVIWTLISWIFRVPAPFFPWP